MVINKKDCVEGGLRKVAKVGWLAALCLLSACAPTTPNWDTAFGESVRMATAQQTLNPDASRNTDPVSGIDGAAARETIKLYEKSFTKPEPQPNVFTIGVSGAR
jgi:hypothetical protein